MKQHELPRKIEAEAFQTKLLNWYHKNKRYMPWREDPKPYHVWISEIMLQQTRVEAVQGYYLRFLKRLPDIESLARADDEELHKLWEGLGYYNRAKNLKKAAEILVEQYKAQLPETYEELLTLPGIGPYTAGAIASIAFHQAVAAVDGNVMRVISRISGDDRDIMEQSTRKAMEVIVQELILPEEVHHFNQALMELGALVCIPNGAPKCESCPVKELCYAYESGLQSVFPVKKPKKQRKIEERTVLIFADENGEFLIQKREKKGLLSGLWEFPQIEAKLSQSELKDLLETHGIYAKQITQIESSKHIFTHIEWLMQGYFIEISKASELKFEQIVKDNDLALIDYDVTLTEFHKVAESKFYDLNVHDEKEAHLSKAQKSSVRTKTSESQKLSVNTKTSESQKSSSDMKTSAVQKKSINAKATSDCKTSEESRTLEESKTSEEYKTITFQKERIWCDFETLKRQYSIPTAFKTYVESIEKGMTRFVLK